MDLNDFGVKKADYMKISGSLLKINHRDAGSRIYAYANVRIDYCYARAYDVVARRWYLLVDLRGTE